MLPRIGILQCKAAFGLQTTVAEALWFSARLRQPSSVSNKTLKDFISEVRPCRLAFQLLKDLMHSLLLCPKRMMAILTATSHGVFLCSCICIHGRAC